MAHQWTPWQPLDDKRALTGRALAETLDGGQAFRWTFLVSENCWQGIWSNHIARLRLSDQSTLLASFPQETESPLAALHHYLGAETDWTGLADSLPWRSDSHLARCMQFLPQLRLLQQPFPETLLAFLCSATKQIPQIKIMCANLAAALGAEIIPGHHALPTWAQLAEASEQALRGLGLGFRAKNIKRTADTLATQPEKLAEIEQAPYQDAKQLLLELPGVGEKIADCALLFGARKLQAFPVDTWILKVLQNRYALLGWQNAQLAQFGRIHFGPYAGYAQQFLFAWERAHK